MHTGGRNVANRMDIAYESIFNKPIMYPFVHDQLITLNIKERSLSALLEKCAAFTEAVQFDTDKVTSGHVTY